MSKLLLADHVAIAQARIILNSVRLNVVASLVTSTALVVILSREQSLLFLIPWYLVFCSLTAFRYYHAQALRDAELTKQNYGRVIGQLTMLAIAVGTHWGILAFASIDDSQLTTSFILMMIYTGLVANAAATLSHSLLLFLGFVFPMMLPAAYKFYLLGETQYYWVAALIFFYLGVTLINIRAIRAAFRESIELRFENLSLIEGLKVQNTKTQSALDKAEQANLSKSRFFAAASHDLRQPLQSLSMFTATLATKDHKSGQKKIVGQIEKSVKALEGLFNSLLDISSLDAGTLKFQKQHVCLQSQVKQISAELAEQAKAKSLYFKVDVEPEIVYTDPVLLGRMLRNLIDNAIRYTPSGGILISSKAVDDEIVLSVKDTGIGISKVAQSSIFGEFVQLNNPERDRNKGLGLGLSIVQRICAMLDIRLTLASEVQSGSIFSVAIERGDANKLVQPELVEETATQIAELFVLIIDDEEDVRLSLEGLLSEWGCVVMVASSGKEAVQQLIEYGSCPDVLISDYRLRGNETGGDAIAMVRSHCTTEPSAIIVTGDIAPDRLIEIDKLDLPVLHKPCNPQKLRRLLQHVS